MITEDGLIALGHVAWEATGLITQTALMLRHFEDVKEGLVDPRAKMWSYGRHVLSAIGPGITSGVMINLTDAQFRELMQEMESVAMVPSFGHDGLRGLGQETWRGYKKPSSPCLLPVHIKEALRRLNREPGKPTSFLPSVTAAFVTGRAVV